MQVAEEARRYAFGQASDMIKFGPKAQLTSIIDNWAPYYIERVQAVMDGTWTSTDTWGGIKEARGDGALHQHARRREGDGAKTEAAIAAGTLHPFTGPVNKQDGSGGCKGGEASPTADPRHELLRQGRRRQAAREVTRRHQRQNHHAPGRALRPGVAVIGWWDTKRGSVGPGNFGYWQFRDRTCPVPSDGRLRTPHAPNNSGALALGERVPGAA